MSEQDPAGGYPYQPYGAPYGGQPPPGYGYDYGPPQPPRSEGPKAAAIVALVLNLLAIVSCCNVLAIPGAVLAGMALSKAPIEPARARGMLVWSWVLFGLGFVLTLSTFLTLGFNGFFDDNRG
jgi:cytochrome c biogenesis protein CcdA